AELFDNRTKSGVIKGKISYMSPEQLGEKQIDLRSDIFSIGILLYEMLSGQRMFTGDTGSLIRKCLQVDYEQLEKVSPGLFPGVYQIVNKALQKDRNKRYQTCSEMHEAIEDCLFAMGQRPNTQALKEYVLQLFEQGFENEKQRLSTTIERSGEVLHNGRISPHSDEGSLPFTSKNEDKTAVMGSAEVTQVLDRADTTSNLSVPVYHELISALSNPPRRVFLVGIFFYIITVFSLFVGLSTLVVEPSIEGHVQGEFAVMPQVQTIKSADLSPQEHLQYIPVIKKDHEKKISTYQYEINVLLDKANTAFRYRRLTVPKGDSAFTYYKNVLNIAPDNEAARDGLRQVSEKYADYAEKELLEEKVIAAQGNIQKGLEVYPQSGRLSELRIRAEQEKKRLIKALEKKAQRSLANDMLTSPVNDCAYKYYKDIEVLSPNSVVASEGVRRIADRYAELADTSYRNLNLTNSREYVKKGLKVKPDHHRLLGIKEDLSRSSAGIFFKMLEKNVKTVVE
ncbi:MAG: protein kinase, partial [Desulfobulbaceae bacterium]|nr:protein kinase [Desulfobulbaceae bacterium]